MQQCWTLQFGAAAAEVCCMCRQRSLLEPGSLGTTTVPAQTDAVYSVNCTPSQQLGHGVVL